jgi:hypothetical protein
VTVDQIVATITLDHVVATMILDTAVALDTIAAFVSPFVALLR